ncbi:hypothetical protein Syn7502_03161 [Synechococcus sp. PCC 7502]|uniref:hypothetical protein n=1 Tax=Synechococcus sp. PCC 7502 TaxID=1173263 RepID=UPI00029FBA6E|nr:hypothetical protein [Synechococcus sp. PCC 7502]AFY75049.1 hypothetical protein Syn7502_03161 [Synechococcus sp. PCC 7502]
MDTQTLQKIYRSLIKQILVRDSSIVSITLFDGFVYYPQPKITLPYRLNASKNLHIRKSTQVKVCRVDGSSAIGTVVGKPSKNLIEINVGGDVLTFQRFLGRQVIDGEVVSVRNCKVWFEVIDVDFKRLENSETRP